MEGKFEGTTSRRQTDASTHIHDQGKSHLCWAYASADSLLKSLLIKIGIGKFKNFQSAPVVQ